LNVQSRPRRLSADSPPSASASPADEEPFFGFPLEEQIAVAPGVVDSPLHKDDPSDSPTTFQQMGKIVEIKDVVDAVLYLVRAGQVPGRHFTWMVALTLAVGSRQTFNFIPGRTGTSARPNSKPLAASRGTSPVPIAERTSQLSAQQD
jgi:hypothetical protein